MYIYIIYNILYIYLHRYKYISSLKYWELPFGERLPKES